MNILEPSSGMQNHFAPAGIMLSVHDMTIHGPRPGRTGCRQHACSCAPAAPEGQPPAWRSQLPQKRPKGSLHCLDLPYGSPLK